MQSVIESGISYDTIALDKISEHIVGVIFDVNTYNQPGVELGKQILYKNLGNK